jgi:hypothetical protein
MSRVPKDLPQTIHLTARHGKNDQLLVYLLHLSAPGSFGYSLVVSREELAQRLAYPGEQVGPETPRTYGSSIL